MEPRGDRVAFGAPGIEPRWTHSNKDGIGTAYSGDARLWYTLWRGTVTEVYFHSIDQPHLRDLEFLFTDGETFFHEEKRHLSATTERPSEHALGYRVRGEAPGGRYEVEKEIFGDPHVPCLLVRTRIRVLDRELVGRLRAFVLAAPHLEGGGWGNSAAVCESLGRAVLGAEKGSAALALAATVPFVRASVGYVGASDGWTALARTRDLGDDFDFDLAPNGNVALTGELPLGEETEFTLALAFGGTMQSAVARLWQSLGTPFEVHRHRFHAQWTRTGTHLRELAPSSGDGGRLFRASASILLAHEDKVYPGAFIASLSIPWGSAKGDDDRGGYHLVWTRDLVSTATGLLAAGHTEAPLRALIYLATQQGADGGFPQNFWVDGTPYWRGVQLDEVALPLVLARRLATAGALAEFDPYPMVLRGARFLIQHGPATPQDRWEEVGGFSPSTLAASIAGLTAAAAFARERGDPGTARFLEEHADFLEEHVERWTVTETGSLLPGVRRHYVRLRPVAAGDPEPNEGPDLGSLRLPNLPPGTSDMVPAAEVVDPGFLDLVRWGIRRPDDPLIRDSLRVVDHLLRVETPFGPVWRRYNHDGYGTRDDGGPYQDWGTGRAWPLLTGERGHYELAAGRDPKPYLAAMERFATSTGLLPEQVWDLSDRPELHLELGRPTESAVPLAWAHAEYLQLLRSTADGAVFAMLPEVRERYLRHPERRRHLEVWKFNRRPRTMRVGDLLRVVTDQPFRLRASSDDWATVAEPTAEETSLGLYHADLAPLDRPADRWEFTFYWPLPDRWEGRNFTVTAVER